MPKRAMGTFPWVITAIVAFVVLDAALVYFALSPPQQQAPADSGSALETSLPSTTATPVPAVTATPSASPAASTAPTPTPTQTAGTSLKTSTSTPAPTPGAAAGYITDFSSALVGYRATPGSCAGTSTSTATDSVLQRTSDGGATWTTVSPTNIRVRQVERLVAVDDAHVDVLGRYGTACTLSDISSYTSGEFWQVYPDRTATFPN
ncbi:hypothetical protein [Subtercola sp. RTI3]|uniref:hypothetical protein n=1 Tax=Subtercola sp. RTI3 TaxID=3048639 RepID=UPI002B2284D4|nr:hypothetical protein [Subtercola sp. RTI3]MEA9985942.1 hypothetical protein [Subtercola sp. RTI3]